MLQDCKRAIAYKVTPYQGRMQPGAVIESTPSLQPLCKAPGTDLPRVGLCSYSAFLLCSPSDGGYICMARHQQCWQPRKELLGKSEWWEDFHILQPPGLLYATLLQLSPSRALNLPSLSLWLPFPCLVYFYGKSLSNCLISLFLILCHDTSWNNPHMQIVSSSSKFQCSKKTSAFPGLKSATHLYDTEVKCKLPERETQVWNTKLTSIALPWTGCAPCTQQVSDTKVTLAPGGAVKGIKPLLPGGNQITAGFSHQKLKLGECSIYS